MSFAMTIRVMLPTIRLSTVCVRADYQGPYLRTSYDISEASDLSISTNSKPMIYRKLYENTTHAESFTVKWEFLTHCCENQTSLSNKCKISTSGRMQPSSHFGAMELITVLPCRHSSTPKWSEVREDGVPCSRTQHWCTNVERGLAWYFS